MSARAASLVGLACAGAALAACDPKPTFPPAEQPLVGVVLLERELAGAGDVPFFVGPIRVGTLSIPAGALPAGTRVVVRFVRGVAKSLPGGAQAGIWQVDGQPAALQILPASLSFAAPATLTLDNFLQAGSGSFVLSADEADTAWRERGSPTITPDVGDPTRPRPSGGGVTVAAAIDGPHLWSFETVPLPDPSGPHVQIQLSCGGQPLTAPPDALVLGSAGDYTWARTSSGAACPVVESGRFVMNQVMGTATFTPNAGPSRVYSLQVRTSGFQLTTQAANPVECAAQRPSQQFFAPEPAVDADTGCAGSGAEGTDAGTD